MLSALGYRYLVVDPSKYTAFALKDSIPLETIDFLGYEQYRIEELRPQEILNSHISSIEVPENIG